MFYSFFLTKISKDLLFPLHPNDPNQFLQIFPTIFSHFLPRPYFHAFLTKILEDLFSH